MKVGAEQWVAMVAMHAYFVHCMLMLTRLYAIALALITVNLLKVEKNIFLLTIRVHVSPAR